MDTIDPHWRKRLRQERRHIDDPGSETLFVNWETFLEKIFPEPKKKRKNRPKTKIQLRADAICEETWQVASTAEVLLGYYDSVSGQFRPVPQLSLAIKRPPEEYGWTRALPGYEIAFSSAVSAAHGLLAATQAAAAGYDSKTPQLDVFLFQIRAGRIKKGDPRIQDAIRIADKFGFTGNIRERIAEEFHNSEKRVPKEDCDRETDNSLFYDLNPFHTALAYCWVGALFWIMPDQLIANFLLSQKGVRLPTTRQAVSQAVGRMGLVKHDPPIVKSLRPGFQLTFIEGFPPKS